MLPEALLHGWGRTVATRATVLDPGSIQEVVGGLVAPPKRGLIARGLGRSYGDAAQNSGGTVMRMTSLCGIHHLDSERNEICVDAGMSLENLMREVLPFGMLPWVMPGTRHVTIGGAIAADIHGKNHHQDGSFGAHVKELDLHTPGVGGVRARLDGQGIEADAFWATVGGMGLTGIITRATLDLQRVETAFMRVDTERAENLDDVMSRMLEGDAAYQYSVAWIDLLATGKALGRSVLTRGHHARLTDLPPQVQSDPLRFDPSTPFRAPSWMPSNLLNRLTVRSFNELWFRKAPKLERDRLETIQTFFHPLDFVGQWNRIYGRSGLVQWQCVVPEGMEGEVALRRIVERFSVTGIASFLAVLKRFGPANKAPLSFPMKGWTLALDIPARGGVEVSFLLDELDQIVVDAGGRVYLAKDSRLRPELLPLMYPDLERWQGVRSLLDPEAVLQSDLARRLWTLRAPPEAI